MCASKDLKMTSKQLPHSWGVGEDLNSHLLKLGPNISKPTYIMGLRPLYKYFTLLVVDFRRRNIMSMDIKF